MNDGLKYFIFLAFAMMVLQSFLSYLQYKSYQKAVSALQGRGWILGIAQGRLSYKRRRHYCAGMGPGNQPGHGL